MSCTVTADQFELLKHAVDSYCTACGIYDREERLYIADLATSLLELGAISLHDLRRGLEDAVGPCERSAA